MLTLAQVSCKTQTDFSMVGRYPVFELAPRRCWNSQPPNVFGAALRSATIPDQRHKDLVVSKCYWLFRKFGSTGQLPMQNPRRG